MASSISLLIATAADLQNQLTEGTLSSVELVTAAHEQISQHDDYLNAIIELAPQALKQAKYLDEQRALGNVLGPLHGIPILIKVLVFRHTISIERFNKLNNRTILPPILA
jgi:amidase